MSDDRKTQLSAKMIACSYNVKTLLNKISTLEMNIKLSTDEKMMQLKKIKEEIAKVGTEIDNIKNEIILLNAYNVN